MRFTLRQLSYFVAAGETGSITLASQRAHISQPSISAAISQLESQFGIQLFIRHHAQGLSLTPTGERFLDAARQLLRHANDLHDFADEIANRVAGPLRVGVFRTLAPLLMPALMSRFLEQHPQVEFSLYEGDESELTAKLRSAELDIVISYDQPTADVLFEPLARLPTYVLLPENHRFARRSNVPLGEIAAEPFVLLDLPISREYFFSLFARLNIVPNVYVASTQPETVRSYVAAGLGFSLLTAKPVNRRALTGEGLAYVALADDFPPMVLSVATLANVRPSRAASAYLEYLRHTVSDRNLPGMEGAGGVMDHNPPVARAVGLLLATLATLLLAGCTPSSPSQSAADERVLNVYNWYDYIKPDELRQFQAQTGIVVHYDVFDSNETLAARLLAGHSGYDVVFPSGASYLQMLGRAGAIRALDKSGLPNLANMDPVIMRELARHDPGNAHAVVYAWGITGFAYDEAQIRSHLPQAPLDSWAMLFDPKIAARFADCGIGLYESPAVIVPSVLAWLGEKPDSEDPEVLARAAAALMAVRPYIRKIGSDSLVAQLAEGDLCLVIASNGDALQARERVRIAGSNRAIGFSIPREGAVMWIDTAAIVADAPHPDNARRFINFLMDAKVAAENANAIHFPNGNAASQPLVQAQLTNAVIYPRGAQAARLIPERLGSDAFVRLRTRMWTRFRTGK